MNSLKRIWLFAVVASVVAVFALMVVVVAHSGNPALTSTAERRVKVLRRKDQKDLKPTAEEIAIANGQAKEERSLEDKTPKHLPIKVKLKADKERQFKDLDNPYWARDLEIEVKNTGTKAIYSLVLLLLLPEADIHDGRLLFSLRYGRESLSMFQDPLETAQPNDISIKPGETYVFRIQPAQVEAWKRAQARNNWRQPKKLVIEFEQLSFGDGTGFRGAEAAPWPVNKKVGLNNCRGKSQLPKAHHARSNRIKTNSAPECCSTGCQWVREYNSDTACYATIGCDNIRRVDVEPCNFAGACRYVVWRSQLCIVEENDYSYEHYCPYSDTYACESPQGDGGGGAGGGASGTGGSTTGDGGGNSPFGCTDYYWIIFVSVDGGPWQLLDVSYAGCW